MKKILVGEITKGHGLQGEAKVRVFSADPEKRFKKKAVLFFEKDGQEKELTIEAVRQHMEAVLIKFKDYPDLTAIEPLFGGKLYVSADSLPKGIYVYQLKECSVYDQDDQLIGPVIEVIENVQLILRVKTIDRDILIPYVPVFIKNVDTETKKITVQWMEGL